MRVLMGVWIAAGLLLPALPARAEIAGPACVTDGDTIVIGGKRQQGRCVGGTVVGLFGIDAPELQQTCKHRSGQEFLCGRAAASFLLEQVKGQQVRCVGNAWDPNRRVLAICQVGGQDLNALMVREGWALAQRDHSDRYVADEAWSREAGKGVWGMELVPPWEWRSKNR